MVSIEKKTRIYSDILAYVALFLGIVVLIGWLANIPLLIQLLPTLTPMQFNTALMFVVLSIALLLSLRFRNGLVSTSFALFGLLFAGATFLQYVFDWNLGLDEFFQDAYIATRSTYPGRMAPNTAICFVFIGIGVAVLNFSNHKKRNWISACFAVLAFSFGAVSLIGYFGSLEEAYGWGELTDMAPHTAVGFTLLGTALFVRALTFDLQGKVASWSLIPLVITAFTMAILLLRSIEVARVQALAEGYKYENNYVIILALLTVLLVTYQLIRIAIRLTSALEVAKLKADVSNQSKEMILRYVGHEIRNPLTAVIGFSEHVLDSPGVAREVNEAVDCIYTAAIHMKSVVDDLLAFSRFDLGKMQIDSHEYNVNTWISGIVRALTKRAEKQSIDFVLEMSETVPETLRGDSSKLAQIVINLVENAFKYTPQGGTVRLNLCVEERGGALPALLKIEVSDTGRGIPLELQEQVFEPFFQTQKSDQLLGIGMGLSICKRFIEMMGGSIAFTSELGKGTTFTCQVEAYLK